MPRLRLDPFSAEFRADPYPTYDRLRDEAPVHRSPFGSWLVSEYDDVATLLHDRRAVSTGAWRPPEGFGSFESHGPLSRMQDASLLSRDPPVHTFMRKLMNAGFKPRLIEEMRSEI